jgi:Tfp pilus assembly PilM family ATPase
MQQFFRKWWHTGPHSLGCSIDDHSLTLVEWGAVGPAPAGAQRWVQEAWAPGKVRDQGIWHDPAQLGAAVQALWQRAGMRCRRLDLGLPADRVVQQTWRLEAGLPDKDIRAQVNWRASQALALAWDEVAFDYRLESETQSESDLATQAPVADSMHAIQVKWLACPMAVVQAARQMSHSAGLHLRFLGVEPAHTPLVDALRGGDPALLPQWHGACDIARQGAMA